VTLTGNTIHRVLKNVPPLACYNFDTCERTLTFSGRNVTYRPTSYIPIRTRFLLAFFLFHILRSLNVSSDSVMQTKKTIVFLVSENNSAFTGNRFLVEGDGGVMQAAFGRQERYVGDVGSQ